MADRLRGLRVSLTCDVEGWDEYGRLMGQVANYVIELLAEILGEEPEREARFAWALGDLSEKTGRRARLPFDAVWRSRRLIVEVDEPQHREPVEFGDKPHVTTVSGVPRGAQRAVYDRRKRAAARAEGFILIELEWERRPPPARRDREADKNRLVAALRNGGVTL
jgi:hypothetical protein